LFNGLLLKRLSLGIEYLAYADDIVIVATGRDTIELSAMPTMATNIF